MIHNDIAKYCLQYKIVHALFCFVGKKGGTFGEREVAVGGRGKD